MEANKNNLALQNALFRCEFEKIVQFICDMCNCLETEYKLHGHKLPNDENKIRTILLEEYIKKHRRTHNMMDFRFEPEAQENYAGFGEYRGKSGYTHSSEK